MSSTIVSVGIDVSQDSLFVSIAEGKPFCISNDKVSVRKLAGLLDPSAEVQLEASGGYERLVRRTLTECGLKVCLHNPLKTKRIAQARGVRAKTDAIDAVQLSRSGPLLSADECKSVERERLCDFSRGIEAMKATLSDYKRRLQAPELDKNTRTEYARLCRTLDRQIARMEKQFVERVNASASANQYALALSVPGIGPRTARVCITELPENAVEATPGQIASYTGLAPMDCASGKSVRTSRVGKGNSRLKGAMYMAAMSAIADQTWATSLYRRLRAEGRGHQTAIVAVMRRQLIRVHAVLKRGSPWQKEPPRLDN